MSGTLLAVVVVAMSIILIIGISWHISSIQPILGNQGSPFQIYCRCFIPLHIGFQHVSTILLVVQDFAGPSTVCSNGFNPIFCYLWLNPVHSLMLIIYYDPYLSRPPKKRRKVMNSVSRILVWWLFFHGFPTFLNMFPKLCPYVPTRYTSFGAFLNVRACVFVAARRLPERWTQFAANLKL